MPAVAVTRATKFQVLNSTTTSNSPLALFNGEFAWNSPDTKLWIGNSAQSPIPIHLMPTPNTTGYTSAWNNTTGKWDSVSSLKINNSANTVSIGNGMSPHGTISLSALSSYTGSTGGTNGLNIQLANYGFGDFVTLLAGNIGVTSTADSVLYIGGSTVVLAAKNGASMITRASFSLTDGVVLSGDKIVVADLPVGPTGVPTGGLYRASGSSGAAVLIK